MRTTRPGPSRYRSGPPRFPRTAPPPTDYWRPPIARCTSTSDSGSPDRPLRRACLARRHPGPFVDAPRQTAWAWVGPHHVVQHISLEAATRHLVRPTARQDDHPQVSSTVGRANALQRGKAELFTQPQVEEDHVRPQASRLLHHLVVVRHHFHLIAIELKLEFVHLGDRRIVLDEQNPDRIFDGMLGC